MDRKKKNPHLGSSLDSLLLADGILEETTARAKRKVLAFQLAEAMREQHVSKSELARRMNTSRSQIDNLLDPEKNTFRIDTAEKAAAALGKALVVELV